MPRVIVKFGRVVVCGVAVCVSTAPTPARTDPATDRATAQQLFDEARKLLSEARYAEACQMFAESQRLDAGGGTLLNLAICHEKQGRTATAWEEFHEVQAQATREGRADREGTATRHMAALAPNLSRLTVSLSSEAREIAGLELELDGSARALAALGVATPVDPGQHEILARAPGRKSWSVSVAVAAKETKSVEIPPLELVTREVAARSIDAKADSRATVGYVVGGVGVALLAAGTYFGLEAMARKDKSYALGCDATSCPDEAAKAKYEEAQAFAHWSTAGFGSGLVAVGLGAYFVLSKPTAKEPATISSVSIRPSASGGMVSVAGAF